MPNELFRKRLISAVHNAQRCYADAALVDHSGLRGRVREILTSQLLSIVLPAQFKIGAGKIIDCDGAQSSETDIVVYDDSLLPSILYSERDGLFPVEACFISMEVKSRLTATELHDAIAKARRVRSLKYQPGTFDEQHNPKEHILTPVISALFAFEGDLGTKSEFDRYAESDPDWSTNPLLRAVCVVGRGYWWFDLTRKKWVEHSATEELEEVVDFLALAANTVIHSVGRRGRPRLGRYLIRNRPLRFPRDV